MLHCSAAAFFVLYLLWSTQEAKVLSYIKVILKKLHGNLRGHSTS